MKKLGRRNPRREKNPTPEDKQKPIEAAPARRQTEGDSNRRNKEGVE